MKKISTTNLISIIIIVILTVAFAIFLPIYLNHYKHERELYEQEKISFSIREDLIGEYTFEELMQISPAVDFSAVYKPNNQLPIERTYSGIFLYDLLCSMDIDLEGINEAVFTAKDGLKKIYSITEIREERNIYIAHKVNGKNFNKGILASAYSKPEEDGGPYVLIKAKEQVSQGRIKMLVKIELR